MSTRARWLLAISLPLCGILAAAGPTSRPANDAGDPSMDWLLSQASTAPSVASTQEAATAPSVFVQKEDSEGRQAVLKMNNGDTFSGTFVTTAGQPIRIYDNAEKKYRDIPFNLIKSLEASVLWERQEQEWKFKNTGSDEKEYSGKSYPARETEYTMTLKSGQKITGAISAPLYLQRDEGSKLFVLHKRDKGDVGESLEELTYVKTVEFKSDK